MMSVTISEELKAIEQRLEKEGDTEAVRKEFWRIVGKIKRMDPDKLDEATIEKASDIRNHLFKQKVVLSLGKGLIVFFLIAHLTFVCFLWTLLYFEIIISLFVTLPPFILLIVLNGIILVLCLFIVYGIYPWGRYLGGVIARVKFEGFYRYSPVELGLKIEYTSYLQTTQSRRKWVFGFPILVVFGYLLVLLIISWWLNYTGIWAPLFLVSGFGIFYLIIYYKKTGELYRFIRELRIERELEPKTK